MNSRWRWRSGRSRYTTRVPDIPAYGEGETEEEAIADLKEALGTKAGFFPAAPGLGWPEWTE